MAPRSVTSRLGTLSPRASLSVSFKPLLAWIAQPPQNRAMRPNAADRIGDRAQIPQHRPVQTERHTLASPAIGPVVDLARGHHVAIGSYQGAADRNLQPAAILAGVDGRLSKLEKLFQSIERECADRACFASPAQRAPVRLCDKKALPSGLPAPAARNKSLCPPFLKSAQGAEK